MREYLVTVLLAAIITYLITPFVRDLAIKSGAIAQSARGIFTGSRVLFFLVDQAPFFGCGLLVFLGSRPNTRRHSSA